MPPSKIEIRVGFANVLTHSNILGLYEQTYLRLEESERSGVVGVSRLTVALQEHYKAIKEETEPRGFEDRESSRRFPAAV